MATKREVHMMDKKEDIDRCLNCKYSDCTDVCPHSPYYRQYVRAKERKKEPTENDKKRAQKRFTSHQLTRARKVSELYRLGWSMTGIAFKLGLTRAEAVEAMQVAVKAKIYQ